MPIGSRLFDEIGARPLAVTGLSIITVALYLLSRITLDTSLVMVMVPLGFIGTGMGLSMMTINTHVLQSAPRRLVSRVTPLTTAAQQVMVSFTVAGLTGYLTTRIAHYIEESSTADNPLTASVSAFGDTFLLAAGIAVVVAVVALILRKPKKKRLKKMLRREHRNQIQT